MRSAPIDTTRLHGGVGAPKVGGVDRLPAAGCKGAGFRITVRLEVAVLAEQLEDEAHEERSGDWT